MKYELHVPIEQYGFVSGVLDTEDVSEVRTAYERIKRSFTDQPELLAKEWNLIVDAVLNNTLILSAESWEQMSEFQKEFLQTIKRSRNRIKS